MAFSSTLAKNGNPVKFLAKLPFFDKIFAKISRMVLLLFVASFPSNQRTAAKKLFQKQRHYQERCLSCFSKRHTNLEVNKFLETYKMRLSPS
jgi:hypothetical protein